MSGITVITSFSKEGYDRYARRFMETREKYWSKDIHLVIYSEGQPDIWGSNFTEIDIDTVKPCTEFLKRHKLNPAAAGRKRLERMRWKTKEVSEGYSYRHDAMKFCRKPFVIADLIQREWPNDNKKLFWIDADTVTHRPVTPAMFEATMPGQTDLCYLGRDKKHSECGFMGFDMESPAALGLIVGLARMYETDKVFLEQEWHDSFIFDIVRQRLPLTENNISVPPRQGSVFDHSQVGHYMRHDKGDRKDRR